MRGSGGVRIRRVAGWCPGRCRQCHAAGMKGCGGAGAGGEASGQLAVARCGVGVGGWEMTSAVGTKVVGRCSGCYHMPCCRYEGVWEGGSTQGRREGACTQLCWQCLEFPYLPPKFPSFSPWYAINMPLWPYPYCLLALSLLPYPYCLLALIPIALSLLSTCPPYPPHCPCHCRSKSAPVLCSCPPFSASAGTPPRPSYPPHPFFTAPALP